MAEHPMFVALPEDLIFEACEIARMQGVSLTHLIVEALSESVEAYQQRGWMAERSLLQMEREMHQRVVNVSRTDRSDAYSDRGPQEALHGASERKFRARC